MKANDYQQQALTTAQYPTILVDSMTTTGIVVQRPTSYLYPALGLAGESGEVVEKIKKLIRDKHGVYDSTDVEEIKKELGDVLWYVAVLANEFKLTLEDVMATNTEKLKSRSKRNKIGGNGDNR